MSEQLFKVKHKSYFNIDITSCIPAIGNVVQNTEESDPQTLLLLRILAKQAVGRRCAEISVELNV